MELENYSDSQPRCLRCGRKRKPQYELCGKCYKDGETEDKVMEAVFNYFSEPKFRENGFSPKKDEHCIRIGVYTPRPDVVLFDRQGNLAVVAECKRGGITNYGIEQLWSYLTASDVQFGVFANSTEPDEWIFFENLRRYHFKDDISRSQFEAEIVADRPIESLREEKDRLDREITEIRTRLDRKSGEIKHSRERLDDLNQEIEQMKDQRSQVKEKVDLLRNEGIDLKGEITRLKGEIIQNSKRAKVVKGLKLESTRDSLRKTIDLLSIEKDQVRNEIGAKEQQYTCLSQEVNLLEENRDELKRRENKIKYEQKTLQREKEIWRERQKKREKSEADLKRSISRKIRRIRDIDRLSKLVVVQV